MRTNTTPNAAKVIEANAESRYEVTHADLPLACPMPGMALWNSHPRVYLPIEATGEARCPYCGAMYVFERLTFRPRTTELKPKALSSLRASWQQSSSKILIVGPAWIGDMVLAQSLFKILRQRHPQSRLDVLAPAWTHPLLARMPEVNEAIAAPFTHGRFDLGVRLATRSRLARAALRPRYRVAEFMEVGVGAVGRAHSTSHRFYR